MVRVSVMGGLSSFEGRPTSHLAATKRRRVRTFSPTPCVGSPGRDPCQWFRHADQSRCWTCAHDLRVSRLAGMPRTSRSPNSVTRALCNYPLVLWHVCSELTTIHPSQVTSRDSHHRPCPMSPPPEASRPQGVVACAWTDDRGSGCDILTSLNTRPSSARFVLAMIDAPCTRHTIVPVVYR